MLSNALVGAQEGKNIFDKSLKIRLIIKLKIDLFLNFLRLTFWILFLNRDKPKYKSDDTNQINQEIYDMRQPDF